MEIRKVLDNLEAAEQPSRNLDGQIALALGYTKKVELKPDPDSGELVSINRWFPPGGAKRHINVPNYTTSIDAAFSLAQSKVPDLGGCAWNDGKGVAQIGDGPKCHAATPALALCVAVIRFLHEQSRKALQS